MGSRILFATDLGRLLVIIAIAMSLASLPGAISKEFSLPSVHLGRANVAPSEVWYPAGPAMNSLQMVIFTQQTAELNAIQGNPPQIDLTDTLLTPTLVNYFTPKAGYYVSSPVSPNQYMIQFMMANNFWGCEFQYGSSSCGRQIRQGIAHLVDKISFTNNDPDIAGLPASPIDNPVLPAGGLPSPNPCSWDSNFTESSACTVGGPGGTAYHLATATFSNGFAFKQPGLGSPDFCAAAQHFINAGRAGRMDHNTCVLSQISSDVTAHTVNFFVRNDNNAMLALGESVAEEICALFGQGFVDACAPYLTLTPGGITAFPGFVTSTGSVNLSWGMYTAGYASPPFPCCGDEHLRELTDPFDSLLYFGFNSRLVSGIPSIQQANGKQCSNASLPTSTAPDYTYLCVPSYDSISYQVEYAPCKSTTGDPSSGQTIPTFAACPTAPGGPYATNDFAFSSAYLLTSAATPANFLVPFDLTSLGNFGGAVNLTTNVTPNATNIPSATFGGSSSISITQGTNANATLSVFVPALAPANTYTITVTGTSGSLSHSVTINLVVTSSSATIQSSVTTLSSVSAGLLAESRFGQGAYAIPVYVPSSQFVYLNNWQRVINSGSGIPNYFTELDAYSPNPTQPFTIRQGLAQNTRTVNPYIASDFWDWMIIGSIYDTLNSGNPVSDAQSLGWMTVGEQTLNGQGSQLGYTPPPGTTVTYRITLRSDMFWQNDNSVSHPAMKITSWDVAFSYLSLLGAGAYQAGEAAPLTGVTIISPTTFDLNLNNAGPFTLPYVTSLTILPAYHWSGAGTAWKSTIDNTISACSNQPTASQVIGCFRAQYTLSTTATIGTSTIPAVHCADSAIFSGASGCSHIPGSLLNVDTAKIGATYDPVANGILIGSGPWEAVTNGVVGGGTGVTPCGAEVCSTTPTYTLQRYGSVASITASGCGVSDHYFRSNCTLAIWIWSGNNGDWTHDFNNLQVIRTCSGVTPVPSQCIHWTQGIVGTGGTAITSVQIGAVNRFLGIGWVSPFNWNTSPPDGIVALAPVLYEGSVTYNPASLVGCSSAYPTGGYDC